MNNEQTIVFFEEDIVLIKVLQQEKAMEQGSDLSLQSSYFPQYESNVYNNLN